MAEKWSPKEAVFVLEYMVDFNQTAAAVRAGYGEKTAAVTAARLMRKPKVQAAIADKMGRRAQRLELTADRVLQEIGNIAHFDPIDAYDQEGKLLPVHQMPAHIRKALDGYEEIEGKPGRVKKVKWNDRLRASEMLAKHFGIYGEQAFSASVETGAAGLPADSAIRIVLVKPQ